MPSDPMTSQAAAAAGRRPYIHTPDEVANRHTRAVSDNTLAEIRENGFRAYVDTIQEEKLREMREKILQAMGLTEDALDSMDPDQRAAIERMVAEEIRRRLTAGTALEDQGDGPAVPGGDIPAQVLSAPSGMGGATPGMLEVLEKARAEQDAAGLGGRERTGDDS